MRVVLSTVILQFKRGDMKGKTERVSSAKVVEKITQKRKGQGKAFRLMVKNWKTGTHFLRDGEMSPQIVRAGGRLNRNVAHRVV